MTSETALRLAREIVGPFFTTGNVSAAPEHHLVWHENRVLAVAEIIDRELAALTAEVKRMRERVETFEHISECARRGEEMAQREVERLRADAQRWQFTRDVFHLTDAMIDGAMERRAATLKEQADVRTCPTYRPASFELLDEEGT